MTFKLSKQDKYNLMNAALAGGLTLFGAFTSGKIGWESVIIALSTSCVVMIAKFQKYWESKQNKKGQSQLFNFI